jgi:predicted phosphohydrolase
MENVRDNVFLVNDCAVTIENTRLILSALWTKVKPIHQIAIERSMNDFHLIRNNGNRLTCEDLNQEHEASLAFIKKELAIDQPGISKIVVTHHYPPQYLSDILNEALAVNLTGLISKNGPDYWIFGHHHQNIPDFKIGNTHILTNQMGYVRNSENELFDNRKTLDIAF